MAAEDAASSDAASSDAASSSASPAGDPGVPGGQPVSREVPAPPGQDPAGLVDALEERVMASSAVQPDERDGGEDDGPVEGVIAHDEDVQAVPPAP